MCVGVGVGFKIGFSFSHTSFPTEPSPKPHPLKNDDLLVCGYTQETKRLRDLCMYICTTVYLCACSQEQLAGVGSVLPPCGSWDQNHICHHTWWSEI